VEIKKTHATPEENREGCVWVELCATSVIHNTDDKFVCIRCPNRYCADCQNEFKRRQELWKQEREREERRKVMIEKMAQQRKEEAKRMADELEEKERQRKQNEEKERQHKIKLIEFHRRQDEERFRLRREEDERKRKEEEVRIQKQKEEQRIAHERELRISHMNRRYKLDYMEVLKEIKTTVKWIEPIKPPLKKMVLATNTSCKSRYCLSCKRYNDGITNRCVCERPRYKPLNGVLLFA
jgi:isochorismate synthase EntC